MGQQPNSRTIETIVRRVNSRTIWDNRPTAEACRRGWGAHAVVWLFPYALRLTPATAASILGRIRTCDLSFRKAALYPTELLGQLAINILKKCPLLSSKQRNFLRHHSAGPSP